MSLDRAAECLARARRQLPKVQNAADHKYPDPESAVTWAFYAYENCVIALAEMHDQTWETNHYNKARLARRLFADGRISRDIGDELEELNRLRKDVAYADPGPELEDKDLDILASDLEDFIDEIQSRLDALK